MGHQQSPVESLDTTDFKPIPKGKVIAGKYVNIDGFLVIQDAKGQLYTNATTLKDKNYCRGSWHWSRQLAKALDVLGLLSPADKAKHEAFLAACETRDETVSALGELKRMGNKPILDARARKSLLSVAQRLWNKAEPRTRANAKYHGYQPQGTL